MSDVQWRNGMKNRSHKHTAGSHASWGSHFARTPPPTTPKPLDWVYPQHSSSLSCARTHSTHTSPVGEQRRMGMGVCIHVFQIDRRDGQDELELTPCTRFGAF